MEANKLLMAAAVVALAAGFAYLMFFASPISADSGSASATDFAELAQCLTDKGAVMYGTDWCPHCKNQKAMFGEAFSKINYVNCDLNKQACIDAGVQGYPTWHINGEVLLGTQPLDRLAEVAGCEYPKG